MATVCGHINWMPKHFRDLYITAVVIIALGKWLQESIHKSCYYPLNSLSNQFLIQEYTMTESFIDYTSTRAIGESYSISNVCYFRNLLWELNLVSQKLYSIPTDWSVKKLIEHHSSKEVVWKLHMWNIFDVVTEEKKGKLPG